MSFRLRSIRQRIFLLILVPVLSLIGLYIFATSITARNAINLARTDTLKNATGLPTGNFLTALDTERPLMMVYLSAPAGVTLAVLKLQEPRTAGTVAPIRASASSTAHIVSAPR